MKISCIIPSYNEGPRIVAVLQAALACPLVDEIIVVDDCSSDDTQEVLAAYPKITYLRQDINQGKSKAVCRGVRAATGDIIFFLDADLMGLTPKDIEELLMPVLLGEVVMTISLRDTYPTKDSTSQRLGFDHLSGERAFRKELIMPHLDTIASLAGFGLETYLNTIIVKHAHSLRIVRWRTVASPLKAYKYHLSGPFVNFRDYLKMWKAVLSVVSPLRAINNIRMMRNLRTYKTPTVSLVIPAYNEERYIARCLEQVTKPKGTQFLEIIVVDNASTDATAEVAQSFKGVKVIHEKYKGVVNARERGFREAKGDIVAFIDADSYPMEGWADYIVEQFASNDSLATLSGICKYYDIPSWQKRLVWLYWYGLAMPVYWMLGYMMVSGNFAIRRSILEKMEGFDTRITFYGDDTDTVRRAKAFGVTRFTPKFFIHTSGRRLNHSGLVRTFFLYVVNFCSEVFFHRPHTEGAEDYR